MRYFLLLSLKRYLGSYRVYMGPISSGSRNNYPRIKNIFVDVVSSLIPPPYLRDDMEFHYGAWAGSSTIVCTDGRPLGEDNAYPGVFRRSVDTDYRTGNFSDSRGGKCYNMTALHHMMKDWDEIMVLLIELRRSYMEYAKIKDDRLSVRQLYLFSKMVVAVNPWLVRNTKIPVESGSLSPVLASMTKLITGVFMIVRHMIETGEQDMFGKKTADEEELFDYADRHGLLISPRDKDFACAGSQRKIIQFMEILITGQGAYRSGHDISKYLELIGDTKHCFDYAEADLEMELNLQLAIVRIIGQVFEEKRGNSSSDLNRITSHVAAHFPACFSDPNILKKHEQNLVQLLEDLGREAWTSFVFSHDTEESISDLYEQLLKELQNHCTLKQGQINDMLGLPVPKPITTKKVHRRLGVMP